MHTTRAFTLIEVLVAMTIFMALMYISAEYLTSIRQAPQSETSVQVTRASGEYLEQATNVWRSNANFGNTNLLTAPSPVKGYSARRQVCTVDITSSTATCGAETAAQPTYLNGAATVPATTGLVRLNIRYVSTTGGQDVTTTLDISRR